MDYILTGASIIVAVLLLMVGIAFIAAIIEIIKRLGS
jgi:hypothetical protein